MRRPRVSPQQPLRGFRERGTSGTSGTSGTCQFDTLDERKWVDHGGPALLWWFSIRKSPWFFGIRNRSTSPGVIDTTYPQHHTHYVGTYPAPSTLATYRPPPRQGKPHTRSRSPRRPARGWILRGLVLAEVGWQLHQVQSRWLRSIWSTTTVAVRSRRHGCRTRDQAASAVPSGGGAGKVCGRERKVKSHLRPSRTTNRGDLN